MSEPKLLGLKPLLENRPRDTDPTLMDSMLYHLVFMQADSEARWSNTHVDAHGDILDGDDIEKIVLACREANREQIRLIELALGVSWEDVIPHLRWETEMERHWNNGIEEVGSNDGEIWHPIINDYPWKLVADLVDGGREMKIRKGQE